VQADLVKKRWRLISVIGLAAAGILAVAAWRELREPAHQGKKLSEWLVAYEESGSNGPEHEAAAAAIRRIGNDGLPWLVRWIRNGGPSAWRIKLRAEFRRLPHPLQWKALNPNPYPSNYFERRADVLATRGFEILGPQASPAIPELARILNHPKASWYLKSQVLEALALIAQEGLPPADTKVLDRALVKCLQASDPVSAANVADVLGELAIEPGFVVPALACAFASTNGQLRASAACSLGQFGKEARVALPGLLEALNDQDDAVRSDAVTALQQIAPEALAQAKVF
jgi:HEAT repeat protein